MWWWKIPGTGSEADNLAEFHRSFVFFSSSPSFHPSNMFRRVCFTALLSFLLCSVSVQGAVCQYSNGDLHFDLSPLSGFDSVVQKPGDLSYSFLFNPCKPLISLPVNNICPEGTLACQVQKYTTVAAYLVGKTQSFSYSQETGGEKEILIFFLILIIF